MSEGITRYRRPIGGAGLLAAFGSARRDLRRGRRRLRPEFLPLEDRRLLTTFDVTKTIDDGSMNTLRWAVEQADMATTPSTVQFFDLLLSTTITLAQGPLVLDNAQDAVTFDLGIGQKPVTIVGNGDGNIFQVDSGVQATMTDMTITGGSTTENGGGVQNAGTLSLSLCTISGNTAAAGGALYNTGKLYLENSTISGNSAVGSGPGIFNLGLADLTDCTLSGNITDAPPVTNPGVPATWIYGQTNSGTGGALFNHGTANLTDCTLAGNTALVGPGVFNYGQCNMIACTVTGNSDTIATTPHAFNGVLFDYEGPTTTGYLTITDVLNTGNDSRDNPFSTTANANTISGTNDEYDGPIGALGNYGGPTETVPLLPGNPAIGAGIRVPGVTTDQRGISLPTTPDVGAFQDQGYVISIDADSTLQSAVTDAEFADPLTVTVTANAPIEPVVGGTVAFTAPSSGPSAQLDATATIGSNDEAQVTATANDTPGTYTVTAGDGGASTVDFTLTNLYPSSFTNLGDQTFSVTYGTPTLMLTGTLSGDSAVPKGEQIAVALDGTTVYPVIQSNGYFSASLDPASLTVSSSAYPIDLSYGGDARFAPATATDLLTVTPATPTLQVVDQSGTYDDSAFTATARVAGVGGSFGPELEGFIPSVQYFKGAFTSPSQINVAPLSGPPVDPGTYTAEATFPGSTDYITYSAVTYFIISPAKPEVIVNDGSGAYSGQPFIAGAALGAVDGATVPSLQGVAPTLTYYPGTYTTVADLGAIQPLSGAPTDPAKYTVLAQFAGSTDYAPNSNLADFTIAPATPTVTVSDPDGPYTGPPFNAAASITGLAGSSSGTSLQQIPLTLTYYRGTYVNLAQLVGVDAIATPTDPGMYTVEASFAGSKDFAANSNIADFTIAAAKPTVTVTDLSGPYTGNAFIAGASVAGLGGAGASSLQGAGLTLTYYSGTYSTAAQLAGVNALPGAPIALGSYTVLASFPGSTDYASNTALADFSITQGMPQITWVPQGTLTFGMPLGSAQLDASANVHGTFNYNPSSGAMLPAGSQTLSATFHPDDTTDYRDATDSVTIEVARAMPALGVTATGGTFDGSPFPASVAIGGGGYAPAASLENTAATLAYYAGTNTSGAGLGSTPPTAPGTYTVVATFPGSTDYAPTTSAPATLTIAPAAATLSLSTSGASSVYVQPVTFVATVTAGNADAGRPDGSVTFLLDGATPIGTVPLDGSGQATLTTSSLAVGSHSVTATYSGNADFLGGASGSLTEMVGPAATQVVLAPHPVLKKKKVKGVALTAEIEPAAPGGGVPTGGLVTFEFSKKHGKKVKIKTLGTASVASGAATLTLKPNKVVKKPLTILFSGDVDYTASTATPPTLTQNALKRLPPPPPA